MAHFGVRCVVFLPDMHVFIVTYHAPTPEVADAGPLLSGRVIQVSTMTLDTLIPRIRDVPLQSVVEPACNMAFTFAWHVEAHEIWLRTVVRYESTFSRTMMRQIYNFREARHDQLGIEWKVIEERIIAVVSDGAGTMGAYVGLLNDIREKGGKELIGWVKDAAHCLMRAISTAKGKVKLWYDALDDLVSFLACFYRTSPKRMRGLWRKGGKFCFSRSTGVRWVEAMFHELDIVLENLPAVVEHLPEYISHEADLGRREKA